MASVIQMKVGRPPETEGYRVGNHDHPDIDVRRMENNGGEIVIEQRHDLIALKPEVVPFLIAALQAVGR